LYNTRNISTLHMCSREFTCKKDIKLTAMFLHPKTPIALVKVSDSICMTIQEPTYLCHYILVVYILNKWMYTTSTLLLQSGTNNHVIQIESFTLYKMDYQQTTSPTNLELVGLMHQNVR